MSRRVGTEDWTIEVPRGWRVQEQTDCLSLLPPSEVGALQLSSHHKKAGPVTDPDLMEFADDHLKAGAPRRDVQLGEFVGFEIAYDADGFSCREWYLRKNRTLLFATYTCGVRSAGVEDEAVELALVSLRLGASRG